MLVHTQSVSQFRVAIKHLDGEELECRSSWIFTHHQSARAVCVCGLQWNVSLNTVNGQPPGCYILCWDCALTVLEVLWFTIINWTLHEQPAALFTVQKYVSSSSPTRLFVLSFPSLFPPPEQGIESSNGIESAAGFVHGMSTRPELCGLQRGIHAFMFPYSRNLVRNWIPRALDTVFCCSCWSCRYSNCSVFAFPQFKWSEW